MKALQKLVRNGNATAVAIPRPFLFKLGWLTGRAVVIELTENCDMVIIRLPNERDFGVSSPPRILVEPEAAKS